MAKLEMKLENIRKNFGGIQALKGVDFELQRGEVHALLGENGAGKSTLIKIITGVHEANDGKIFVRDEEVEIRTPKDARKKGIAAIYQELSLIESLTVAENIYLGNEPTKGVMGVCDRKTLYANSQAYLDKFGIDINPRAMVSDLGMGQKRIVEIVKALAVDSQILLLDEPTTGMSKVEVETLFKIMKNLKENKVTMIYISHYLEEVFKICDRATVLRDGEKIDTFVMNEVSQTQLIKSMIGREIRSQRSRESKDLSGKAVMLELRAYKTDCMQAPISLSVKKSEILGVTGIVGAGKSELAHSLFGHARAESGEILIQGKVVTLSSTRDAKQYRIALVPEDRKKEGLFLEDSVANNMIISSIEKIENGLGFLDQKKKNQLSEKMGESLKVNPLQVNMPVKNLSGGNQQKVVVAKWLMSDPEIIMMDEPTRGIDVGAKTEIYDLIRGLSQKDKSVIVMSSEFEELIDLCDRILVLRKGEVVGQLLPEEVTNEKLLSLSLGG
jgi:ABC-type sugar transport system ATPase subunit